jgi:hypothetical protein
MRRAVLGIALLGLGGCNVVPPLDCVMGVERPGCHRDANGQYGYLYASPWTPPRQGDVVVPMPFVPYSPPPPPPTFYQMPVQQPPPAQQQQPQYQQPYQQQNLQLPPYQPIPQFQPPPQAPTQRYVCKPSYDGVVCR